MQLVQVEARTVGVQGTAGLRGTAGVQRTVELQELRVPMAATPAQCAAPTETVQVAAWALERRSVHVEWVAVEAAQAMAPCPT